MTRWMEDKFKKKKNFSHWNHKIMLMIYLKKKKNVNFHDNVYFILTANKNIYWYISKQKEVFS